MSTAQLIEAYENVLDAYKKRDAAMQAFANTGDPTDNVVWALSEADLGDALSKLNEARGDHA